MALVTSKGASSSFFTHQSKKFNVFLSFRGEDTRRGFTSHLYHALCQQGIDTFIDNDLKKGDKISDELINIIENSTMSIVIFSENYASSTWCLDELAKIVECRSKNGQLVHPVFYKVEPSYVRYQRGKFEEALTKHEERYKNNVQRWRDALSEAAGYSGWHYKVNDSLIEYDLIQKIVEDTFKSKLNQMPLLATEYEVGIKSRVEALIRRLDIESNDDVHMVAVYGLGGVGKTTMARNIYNKISYQFKAKKFLENVRERSETHDGIILLQKTLYDISRNKNLEVVHNVSEGTNMIYEILHLKRVLIVLDDVDDADQIKNLLGKCNWFAPGSRIIMTTRNKQLLDNLRNVSTYDYYDYEVKELDEYEALVLFRKHAFPSNILHEDYLELENQVIHYAKGLPLALKVMGVDLCGRTTQEWKETLDCYEKNPHRDIQKVLKRSYEGLNKNEQIIFLDIACFFKKNDMMNYDMIKDVLEACGLNPISGIRKLIDKCLLTIDQDNYLLMHDLLQQMGMDIVQQEAEKPEERSRLWCYDEALDVVTKNMGSNKIRSIILRAPKLEPKEVLLKAQFCKMTNLRLLMIHNVRCCDGLLEYLPSGLSLLDWREYPFSSWPYEFFPKKLVVLNVPSYRLENPFKLICAFESVTYVDFSECELIEKIPDLSMTPNIKQLNLRLCKNLVEIDDSVGRLDKLEVWDLACCFRLRTLPGCLMMKSLRIFNLLGCSSLNKFPNILHEMKGVKILQLPKPIELPLSFRNLTGLEEVFFRTAIAVPQYLPGSIHSLQHIERLSLRGNSIFPRDVEIDRQPLCNSLGGFSNYVFSSLKQLHLRCFKIRSAKDFILSYCCPLTLEEFYKSKVVTFPESLSRQMLCIRDCDELQEIPKLPQSIIYQMDRDIVQQEALKEHGERSKRWCYEQALEIVTENMGADKIQSIMLLSLESKPTNVQAKEKNFLEMENLRFIIGNVPFHGYLEVLPNGFRKLDWDKYPFSSWPSKFCPKKLVVLNMYLNKSVGPFNLIFAYVKCVDLSFCIVITKIPDLSMTPNIECLNLEFCINLETLILEGDIIFPKGFSNYVFPRLKKLQLRCFTNRSEIDFICNCCCPLTLEELEIGFCNKIVTLPESISRFERLHWLCIYSCDALQEIPRLPQSIRYVDVSNCHSLDSQSLFNQLREIIGLPPNLPPCLGVTSEYHISSDCDSDSDSDSKYYSDSEYHILVPEDENEIPNWFNHQCVGNFLLKKKRGGNLISFSIGPEFPTIALCFAFHKEEDFPDMDYYYGGPEFPTIGLCFAFHKEEDFPDMDYYYGGYINVDISINGSKRWFGISRFHSDKCFLCRPQGSLQKLFQDLNLGDQNHVDLSYEIFASDLYQPFNIKRIGVHVECNCPQPQNGEALGLSMDNYEARSCTCLCGAQTCCRCLKELGSTHSAGRASVHSSNLESQIISSDTNGGRSSLVSVPSNSGLPMDVTNGSETLSLLLDLTQPLVMGLSWLHLYK